MIQMDWLGDGTLNAPASSEPMDDKNCATAQSPRPVRDGKAFSVVLNVMRPSCIEHLLAARCPSAIFRSVWSIVVDAIKRQSGWALAHVSKKVLKLQPAITHGNAASSVVMVSMIQWVEASLSEAIPSAILSCAIHCASTAVCCDRFPPETAAGLGANCNAYLHRLFRSAIAAAQNIVNSLTVFFEWLTYDGQCAEVLTDNWALELSAHVSLSFIES